MMRATLLLPLLMLGGCVTLLPEPPPPPAVFALEARDVGESTNAPVDAVVGIALPSGERAILGSDLVWRTGDQLAFVAQTQWSGRADAALQSMLAETLIRQGRFRSATRSGEARAEFEIRWDVLDFEIDDASMQARFVSEVRLVQSPGRRIVASTIINTSAPVSDRSATQAANALARAAREGSARIGEFAADAAAEALASAEAGN